MESLENPASFTKHAAAAGDYPNGSLRADFARRDPFAAQEGSVDVVAPEGLRARLDALAGDNAFLAYMALFAAVAIYVRRHGGHERFALYAPPVHDEGDSVRLPVYVDCDRWVTFKDALESIKASLRKSYQEQTVQAHAALDDESPAMLVHMQGLHAETASGRNDLDLCLSRSDDGVVLQCRYSRALYRDDTIELSMRQLLALLDAGLAAAETDLARLWHLSTVERNLICRDWNDTTVQYQGERCVQAFLRESAAEAPDRICYVCDGRSYTYAQLAAGARRIAQALHARNMPAGAVVAVFAGRSYSAVAAIVGIIDAGAAYLPLDRMYPQKRIAYLLADADPAFVLAERRLLSELPETQVPVLCIEDLLQSEDHAPLPDAHHPAAPVYLIYTSGSTGNPKGVLLDHRGRVNNFSDFNRRFRIGPADSVLGVSSLSFDMCAYDMLGSFMAGSKLVMVSEQEHSTPSEWLGLMGREQVTLWHSVPSLMENLLDHLERYERPDTVPQGLRLVLLGGDWIPVNMVDRIRAFWPAAEVVSLGGATEVSMDSTIYSIGEIQRHWKSVPYGRAMANQKAYVLDQEHALVPVGMTGELFLGGDGVAWGYHRQPALSAAKFIPDAFSGTPGARLYATGDHARYQPDGQLELLGRMDFQVKIRGLRIELGEVETAVESFPGVTRAVALVNKDSGEAQLITAYVVAERELDLGALRKHLAEQLPFYMIPHQTLQLPQLPLSANGKVDRKALRTIRAPAPAAVPETPVAGIVRALFAEILDVPQVSGEDDFFALGGHSLLALRLMSRLEEVFGIKIPLHAVFESPSAGKLAAHVEEEAARSGIDIGEISHLWQSVNSLSEQGLRELAEREQLNS
ncbi:non-ribosomal peptide synthetase [Dyella flagellata]|uniref:Carrier domain-containing protein n=1 Tax=Dyella flagellata TaxID=1867833 RepID=A0ABQ5X8L7_9GAMM|nr:non-ribosomal peptide synthetase [Dyella flagellata]GLQ87920.1 hypothetical protein GCM10007898_14880 [Dyella flagellata]